LTDGQTYSILLYIMKTRVTFRVSSDLAESLRELPNQTAFVEQAIRDALARACPLCEGAGTMTQPPLRVPDFRARKLPRLGGAAARRLREIVRLGKRSWATDLDLDRDRDAGAWRFRLRRRDEVLLAGAIDDAGDRGVTLSSN
jgi:hypothetical protein